MQKEIRKRTQRYSVIAVISALVLVAFCFSFGVVPFTFPPEFYSDVSPMSTFESYEELKNFIVTNSEGGSYPKYSGGRVDAQFLLKRQEYHFLSLLRSLLKVMPLHPQTQAEISQPLTFKSLVLMK